MFCPKCGNSYEEDSAFCENCGEKLSDQPVHSEHKQDPEATETVMTQTQETPEQDPNKPEPAGEEPASDIAEQESRSRTEEQTEQNQPELRAEEPEPVPVPALTGKGKRNSPTAVALSVVLSVLIFASAVCLGVCLLAREVLRSNVLPEMIREIDRNETFTFDKSVLAEEIHLRIEEEGYDISQQDIENLLNDVRLSENFAHVAEELGAYLTDRDKSFDAVYDSILQAIQTNKELIGEYLGIDLSETEFSEIKAYFKEKIESQNRYDFRVLTKASIGVPLRLLKGLLSQTGIILQAALILIFALIILWICKKRYSVLAYTGTPLLICGVILTFVALFFRWAYTVFFAGVDAFRYVQLLYDSIFPLMFNIGIIALLAGVCLIVLYVLIEAVTRRLVRRRA